MRTRKESYDYSFVWVDADGEMHWDIYNHYTKDDAESLCKAERKFKEVLHAEQYPIAGIEVRKRNKILAKGGIYPNGE